MSLRSDNVTVWGGSNPPFAVKRLCRPLGETSIPGPGVPVSRAKPDLPPGRASSHSDSRTTLAKANALTHQMHRTSAPPRSGLERRTSGYPCIGCFLAGALASAGALHAEALDQFRIVPVPTGIELLPRTLGTKTRDFVYEKDDFAPAELLQFVRSLCGTANATYEIKNPTWVQWLTGQRPASAIC